MKEEITKSGIDKSHIFLCHYKNMVSTQFYGSELELEGWYNISSIPINNYFGNRDTYSLLGFLLYYNNVQVDEEFLEDMSSREEVEEVVQELRLKLNLNMMDDEPITNRITKDNWNGGW